ncbi:MAG: protoporphyrinogen oxidase, partial [Vicinamibacterales bacterium]
KHGSLLRAFREDRRRRGTGTPSDGAFRSLPGGLTELVNALAAALPRDSVHLNSAVTDITRDGPDYRVATNTGRVLSARSVIVAAPAFAASRLLRTLDAPLSRLCDAIEYSSTATILLAFDRQSVAHPLNGSGFVVPRVENTGVLAASWLSSKWPHRAPQGRVLMRAFAGGARDPDAVNRPDGDLVRLALDALTPLLGLRAAPLFSRVYRWTRASAQHNVGHLERMRAIDAALAEHQGLFLTGSGFRGVGIPDCVADARATARQSAERLRGEPFVSQKGLA